MYSHSRLTLLVTMAASVLLAVSATQAAAQAASDIQLQEVVVEATKRSAEEASLPIATTILTPTTLPASSPNPIADITRQVPGSNFMDFGRFGESYLNMRGVATLGSPLNPLDTTVGISVDGAPLSLSALGIPLLDVEKVEVLKGPQGTLFGRNASAGSINVFSRPADGQHELRLDGEIGSDGFAYSQLTAGGWLAQDTIAGRGTVRWQKFGGDIPNAIIGGTENGNEISAAKGSLRFKPNDTLTIDVIGNYSKDRRDNPAFILDGFQGFPASGTDVHPENRRDFASGLVRIAKEFDKAVLTSITSYQDVRFSNYADFTDTLLLNAASGLPPLTPNPLLTNPLIDKYRSHERERVFSQELRLGSKKDAALEWVTGVNYFRSNYNYQTEISSTLWPIPGGTTNNNITSQTVAAFGDVSIPLGQRWKLSTGGRLAYDKQELDGAFIGNRPSTLPTLPAFAQDGKLSDTYGTGRIALSYLWSNQAMTYASVARGYSSGGFDKQTIGAPFGAEAQPFKPASVWTYETGIKAEIAKGIRMNGSLFYNNVLSGQLAYYDPLFQVRLTNQDYHSYGVEGGIVATLLPNFDVSVSAAYIESKQGSPNPDSAVVGAAKDNAVPQIPSFSASAGAVYRIPASFGERSGNYLLEANYQYVGNRYSDLANLEPLKPYHIVNSKIGWEGKNFSLYLFGRNLLDERAEQFAQTIDLNGPLPGSARGVYVSAGRVVGIGGSVKW